MISAREGGSVGDAVGAALDWSRFSPSAMVAMDDQGRVVAMNAAAEALLGTTLAATAGRTYTEVFGPSLADRGSRPSAVKRGR